MNKIVKLYSELSEEEIAIILKRQRRNAHKIFDMQRTLLDMNNRKSNKRLKHIDKVQEDLKDELQCIELGMRFRDRMEEL
ncbi:MAG: hypothetical protein ACRDB0_06120 [Paraclostridium sp.]